MKLSTETNSLVNHMLASVNQPRAKVGDGATICMWTDRKACTIVKVTSSQIHVQEDISTRSDNNGMSENQHYDYMPNTRAPVIIFRKCSRGYKSNQGSFLHVGSRNSYHDYSF